MKFLPILLYLSIPFAYAGTHKGEDGTVGEEDGTFRDMLSESEFDAIGDVDELDKLFEGKIRIGEYSPNDGLGVPLDTRLGDLKFDFTRAQRIQQELEDHTLYDPCRPDDYDPYEGEDYYEPPHRELFHRKFWCPNFLGYGYANNAILTITFGWSYSVMIYCNEKCCTRFWRCTSTYCYMQCSYSYIIVYTGGNVCCNIRGRVVTPFSYGSCVNSLLCIT